MVISFYSNIQLELVGENHFIIISIITVFGSGYVVIQNYYYFNDYDDYYYPV